MSETRHCVSAFPASLLELTSTLPNRSSFGGLDAYTRPASFGPLRFDFAVSMQPPAASALIPPRKLGGSLSRLSAEPNIKKIGTAMRRGRVPAELARQGRNAIAADGCSDTAKLIRTRRALYSHPGRRRRIDLAKSMSAQKG